MTVPKGKKSKKMRVGAQKQSTWYRSFYIHVLYILQCIPTFIIYKHLQYVKCNPIILYDYVYVHKGKLAVDS